MSTPGGIETEGAAEENKGGDSKTTTQREPWGWEKFTKFWEKVPSHGAQVHLLDGNPIVAKKKRRRIKKPWGEKTTEPH